MMREAFERRGRTMHRMLNDIPGVTCIEPQGAFYCFANLQGLLNRPLSGHVSATTLELADTVLGQARVAFVPGEAFGAPGYARFSFAMGDDDLAEGIRRIAEFAAG
jgi:aspartate/methionine/tyrosine aminotransferase